jgi:hypothetical protein
MRVKVSLFFHPVICARDKGEWSIRLTSSAEVDNTVLCFIHSLVSNQALPSVHMYRGADKSLARPTSRCILFDGENISFDVSLVIYK